MTATTAAKTFEVHPVGPYSLEESANFIGAWHQAPAEGGAAAPGASDSHGLRARSRARPRGAGGTGGELEAVPDVGLRVPSPDLRRRRRNDALESEPIAS